MFFKKMIFGVAALAALASGVVQAADAQHGRERRWDFSCHFENQNDCRAFATIYTRRELEGREHDGPSALWGNMSKLAVSCERGGMIYANGASVNFHHDKLIISAANGGRPRLIFDLPIGEHHGGASLSDGHGNSENTEATLLLPNGDLIRGECEYRHHEIH
jgi:hypothetical protein